MRRSKVELAEPEDLADEAPDDDEEAALAPEPSPTPTPAPPPAQPDLRPRPRLDLQAVAESIAAGRTPTCPDCGEALTKVLRPGARVPGGWEAPRPEDHRCDPARLATLERARSFQTRPGETPIEARARKAAERETFTRPDPQESELF